MDRGWSVDTLNGLARIGTLLGEDAVSQFHYRSALAVPTPIPVLVSGFVQSALAYYRLGRLALAGRSGQAKELMLPAIIANFGELLCVFEQATYSV